MLIEKDDVFRRTGPRIPAMLQLGGSTYKIVKSINHEVELEGQGATEKDLAVLSRTTA